MKFHLIALFVFLNISYTNAQINDSESNKLTKELEEIYSRGYITGFSVAIVDQNKVLYTKGFGYSDKNKLKPYTENTIQNIGSISKTFIGIALLKAQELGKLNLDDPINKYLPFEVINPNFPEEKITIRHLATHTSSLKDASVYYKRGYILRESGNPGVKVNSNFRPPNEKVAMDKFLEAIFSQQGKWYKKSNFLKKKPGETFEYSNLGATLAAYILELATKKSFTAFTNEYIFEPLEMSETGWSFEAIDFSKHSKLYNDPETELAFYRLITYPDGGLITSSFDMSKYLSELIRGYEGKGKILSKAGFEELFKQQLTADHFKERSENTYNDEYNSGIFMGFSAKGFIGHTGSDPGVATFMFFDSKTSIGKILMVNTELKKEGITEFIDIWKKMTEFETKLE